MSMMGIVRPTGYLDMTVSVDLIVKFKQTRQTQDSVLIKRIENIYFVYFRDLH